MADGTAYGCGSGRRRTRPGTGRASPCAGTPRSSSHRAAHPYELPASDHVYLFLDDAVHGVGSRACGIDVLPEHALWPSARAFTVWFPAPAQEG